MAHQVKIKLPCVDTNGHDVTIVLDGEIRSNCLETMNGNVYIRKIETPIIDCMPDVNDDGKPIERLDIQNIQISEFGAYLMQLNRTIDNMQASSYGRGYAAALDTVITRFNKIFKED